MTTNNRGTIHTTLPVVNGIYLALAAKHGQKCSRRLIMRIHTLIVCSLLLFSGTAYCDMTYEWTDDRGGVHFTDDPATVPKKYRGKIRATGTLEMEPSAVSQPDMTPARKPEPQARSEELYGGLSLNGWRDSYAALRNREELLKKNVEDARRRHATAHRKKTVLQRAKDRQELMQAKDDLDKAEAALAENAMRIEQLEADAAKAGVPAIWRESTSR
jgi:uncharacterized protein DUF4124